MTDNNRPGEVERRDLVIPVNGVYFDQIVSGAKAAEYRLQTDYWRKRLIDRAYRNVVLTRGYPKGGGVEGVTRCTRLYTGFDARTIRHPHFGRDPVEVFAIHVDTAALTPTASEGAGIAADVRRLIIAARIVTDIGEISEEHFELLNAVEAFASRVPYEDEPDESAEIVTDYNPNAGRGFE